MLKYDEIIKRMSDSEKIKLLCDIRSLSDKNYRAKGIPELKMGSAGSLGAGEFPSPSALSNAWDLSLIGEVADTLAQRAAASGLDLLSVPEPRVRVSPCREALSEDTLLTEAIAKEYLKAAARADVSACVGGFGLYADELEFIDKEPCERFVREFLIKPYANTLSSASCAALIAPRSLQDERYEGVNETLFETAKNRGFGGAVPVGGHVSAEQTVPRLMRGKLFFEGSALAVESALSRYRTLERAVRQGQESEQTLAEEIALGRAISPDRLDEATDQLLDFIFSVKRKHTFDGHAEDETLAARAVRRSAVLLKNEGGILPLPKARKIALIGDVAFAESESGERRVDTLSALLWARGHEIVGKERGYEWNKTRNEDMIDPAVSLANQADAVVLFLGNGDMRMKRMKFTGRISLPANQMALLDRLAANGKKVIAVLPSDELWDIGTAENCAAILTLPMYTEETCAALADILTGVWNPCGKLANTVYSHTDALYTDLRTRRERDGLKTGVFLGYRSYVTSGENVGFAFGHGLSYTKFSYTDIRAEHGTVFVTLKNVGAREGEEVVQLYAKKADCAVLRSERELIGFARVSLRPGEKATVQIPLKLPEVYAREYGRYVTESGDYELLAGASCVDIRLSCTVEANGKALVPDEEKLSDYIHTKSNIITDNYKLEAKVKKMKRSVFNWIAGAAAIIMAIVMKLYCISMEAESPFFDWFALILCAIGLGLFIAEAAYRSKLRKTEQAMLDRENETMFDDAEQIPAYRAETMFVKEFDRADDAVPEAREIRKDGFASEHFLSVDKTVTFASAVNEFETFAKERGCKLRADSARKLFASLASSRLLVFSGLDRLSFQTLLHLLSDYFETGLCIDKTDGTYTNAECVLYRTDSQGSKIRTNTLRAIEFAENMPGKIQIAGLCDVKGEDLDTYFAPFMHYVKHPMSDVNVRIVGDMRVESFRHIPGNLWFALNLAEGETPDRISAEISASAVIDTPVFDLCPESETHTLTKGLGYYQLEYLKERLSLEQSPDESLWRKIDRLEDAVGGATDFTVGNKHWLGLENFTYAYMACGGSAYEAIDSAVAARLIAPMMSAWFAANGGAREFEELVSNAFGDDHGEACEKLVRICIENRT